MTDDESGQIARFRLTKQIAQVRIRTLLKGATSNLVRGDHARDRMDATGHPQR